jgi:hypothetical protein
VDRSCRRSGARRGRPRNTQDPTQPLAPARGLHGDCPSVPRSRDRAAWERAPPFRGRSSGPCHRSPRRSEHSPRGCSPRPSRTRCRSHPRRRPGRSGPVHHPPRHRSPRRCHCRSPSRRGVGWDRYRRSRDPGRPRRGSRPRRDHTRGPRRWAATARRAGHRGGRRVAARLSLRPRSRPAAGPHARARTHSPRGHSPRGHSPRGPCSSRSTRSP